MKKYLIMAALFAGFIQTQGQSFVASVSPMRNVQNVPSSASISLTFSTAIDPATLSRSTVKVYGSLSGSHALKPILYSTVTRTAEIDPLADFSLGETVTIVVTTGVRTSLGEPISAPFSSHFSIGAKAGSGILMQSGFFGTGNQPWAAATADFDRDGVLDFLVLNRNSKSVSLLHNYGAGNYLQISTSPVGTLPSSFAVADMNGDDTPDCAVANEGSNSVSVLQMDTKGVTTRTLTFASPGGPSAIAAADLDADGDMDLIVAGRTTNMVYVYKNDGSGTFTLYGSTFIAGGPTALVTADLNNDGSVDAAIACETANTVTMLANNGGGTLSQSAPISVAAGPVSIAAGDFDNDASMDLVVASKTSGKFTVLRNDGSGAFFPAAVLSGVVSPASVAAADMDGDGMCDVVGLGAVVMVFRNQGYLVFRGLASVVAGSTPHGLVIVDLDGDGDLDCAAPNSVSSSLALFTNRPAVSVSVVPRSLDFGVGRQGDAKQLTVYVYNNGISVPLNIMSVISSNPSVFSCEADDPTIAPLDSTRVTVTFTPAGAGIYSDSLTFVTNDPIIPAVKVYVKGIGGLIVLSTVPAAGGATRDQLPPVTFSFNGVPGPASLRNSTVRLYGDMTALHPAQVGVADRMAIATSPKKFLVGERVTGVLTDSVSTASGEIRLLDGYALHFSVQPERGAEFYAARGLYAAGARPSAAASGDFNGDGYADVAVVNSGDNSVSVFMNTTRGGLASQVIYGVGASPQAVVIADVNGDGASDILTTNASVNSVTILLNNNLGDGRFATAPASVATGASPRGIAVGDFNTDGHLDIVTANAGDNTVSVFRNDGASHLTLVKSIAVGVSPRAVAAADINNDGSTDIAVTNAGSGTVTVLLNERGTFTASTLTAGNAPTWIVADDFNRDGNIDLIVANSTSKTLTVHTNTGDGKFSAPQTVRLFNVPVGLYSGDLSGDGTADLVVSQYSPASAVNTVLFLTNTGDGQFIRTDSVVVESPGGIAGLDLNNGSMLHLAVPNSASGKLSLINPAAGQTPVLLSPQAATTSLRQPVRLVWQTIGRNVAYHVRLSETATGKTIVNDSTAADTFYVPAGLGFSTSYTWTVRAKNAIGWGDFAQEWNFITAIAPPHTPILREPAEAAMEQAAAPLFVWHASATASAYRIQAAEDPLFASIVVDASTSDTSWQSSVLKIHTGYFWRVRASNSGGESEWSPISYFMTYLPPPEKVRLGAPAANARLASSTINFSWYVPQWEVTKYWFEIAADTLFMFRIVDSSVADTAWRMHKFSGNQKYYWKVRAWNAKGWGPFSEISTFSIGPTSVGGDDTRPDRFALEQNFPNPFNPTTQIQFSIAVACPVQLKIFDVLGREVADLVDDRLDAGTYTVRWNASNHPSGIYIYRLTAGTYTGAKKLSLQK